MTLHGASGALGVVRGAPWLCVAALVATLGTGTGCDVNAALQRLSRSSHLSADLVVQFAKATDAANKAVMADTDDASRAFAQEATTAKADVQRTVDALDPLLRELGYTEESGLLQQFTNDFAAYRELDQRILDLAVENTNVKAQRLSFGTAFETADAFSDALERVVPPRAPHMWQVRALVATAVAAVREIQALHAPHIAEPTDAVMVQVEQRMDRAEKAGRSALRDLEPLVAGPFRPTLVEAYAALDHFITLTHQITQLSRRNTDVRSVALSLSNKQQITAACETSLYDLRHALAKRSLTATR